MKIQVHDPFPPKKGIFSNLQYLKELKDFKKKYRRLLERGEKTTNKQNVIIVISIIGQ